MYHSSKRKLRPYLMTISVSQKKFFHIHASLKVKKNLYSTVVLGSNNCTFCITIHSTNLATTAMKDIRYSFPSKIITDMNQYC